MNYGLNDKMPLFPMLLFGLQWLVISIPSIIILGTVTASLNQEGVSEQIFYIQKLVAIVGVGLIIQMLWGHKLPLVMGPASVLLVGIISATDAHPDAVNTAIVLGGITLFILGVSGLFDKIQSVFTPRIVTVILALIAFTLSPVIVRMLFGRTTDALFNFILSLSLSLSMIYLNNRLSGMWRSLVVFMGLVVGTAVCFLVKGLDFPSEVNSVSMFSPEWFNFSFRLDGGVLLSFLFCYMALIVNELGSIQSIGQQIKADKLNERNRRGISVTGLFNSLSGLFGVIGPVDYSLSPGVIAATGCASRFSLIPAGVGLLLLAFMPSCLVFISAIPEVILGTILLYLMGSQLTAALQMMAREKTVSSFNSGLIIGFPLMIALVVSFVPEQALAELPPLIRPILGNGFVIGTLVVLLLEHVVFRNEKKNF